MDRDSQAFRKIAGVKAIPRIWLDDAEPLIQSKYLIKGLIDERSFNVVFGPSGDGKTFLVLDAACHIAAGLSWRGRRVHSGLVVYVAAEGGTRIVRRFCPWRDEKLSEAREAPVPLAIVTRAVNLLDEVEIAELIGALQAISEEAGLPLALVVFDTLARSMAGGDENAAGDMGRVIAAADRIRDELGAACLVVHHSGKDPAKGARGSSALFAAADTVISVVDKVATIEKSRDGHTGEAFPFSLRVVELGEDEDGDKVTTCLIEHDTGPAAPPKVKPPTGRNQKLVWDVIREVVADAGHLMPGTSTIPPGARAASLASVVNRAVPKFPALEAWRARDRVSQALVGLQAAGIVGCQGDYIWLS